jgi:hypothetical protein
LFGDRSSAEFGLSNQDGGRTLEAGNKVKADIDAGREAVQETAIGVASMTPVGRGVAATRALVAADLGVAAAKVELKGSLTLAGKEVVVRIDNIVALGKGAELSPFAIIGSLEKLAGSMGATTLRIEGTIANPRLYDALVKRFGMQSKGATDTITRTIKPWVGLMNMNRTTFLQRAKDQYLKGLKQFTDSADCAGQIEIQSVRQRIKSIDGELLGMYRSLSEPLKVIGITTYGLGSFGKDSSVEFRYDEIISMKLPSTSNNEDTKLVIVTSAGFFSLEIDGVCGRFRDVFSFERFLSKAIWFERQSLR